MPLQYYSTETGIGDIIKNAEDLKVGMLVVAWGYYVITVDYITGNTAAHGHNIKDNWVVFLDFYKDYWHPSMIIHPTIFKKNFAKYISCI